MIAGVNIKIFICGVKYGVKCERASCCASFGSVNRFILLSLSLNYLLLRKIKTIPSLHLFSTYSLRFYLIYPSPPLQFRFLRCFSFFLYLSLYLPPYFSVAFYFFLFFISWSLSFLVSYQRQLKRHQEKMLHSILYQSAQIRSTNTILFAHPRCELTYRSFLLLILINIKNNIN